ncbi:hypothetical protein ACT4MK_46740 [Bradyrhizobium barranii]|uniref:hypothetical protein n=1 Tax=Bradyrhizobium TaxID=374 RepID=UPI003F220FF7
MSGHRKPLFCSMYVVRFSRQAIAPGTVGEAANPQHMQSGEIAGVAAAALRPPMVDTFGAHDTALPANSPRQSVAGVVIASATDPLLLNQRIRSVLLGLTRFARH